MDELGSYADYLQESADADEMPGFLQPQSYGATTPVVGLEGFASNEVIFSLVFGTLALCFVAPPAEVRSAGLTVQNLFGRWLASEQLQFCQHHLARVSVTRLLHACLPALYYLYLGMLAPQLGLLSLAQLRASRPVLGCLLGALLLPLTIAGQLYFWHRDGARRHPVAVALQVAGRGRPELQSWRAVACAVDAEVRRVNKFVSGGPPGRQVLLTESWVLATSAYRLHAAHQEDVLLTLEAAEEHRLALEASGVPGQGAQFLRIDVQSLHREAGRPAPTLFRLRLNALEYVDLRQHLQAARLVSVRNVVVRESVSERFVVAFRQQTAGNPPFALPAGTEVEQCIGCMEVPADVKLSKNCADGEIGPCRRCFCRPMWCCSCTARWFAARQLQDGVEPERWMQQRAPCPNCRAIFCLLDVCPLPPPEAL